MKYIKRDLKHKEDNKRFLDLLSYVISKRDLEGLRSLLNNASDYTKDYEFLKRIKNMFITSNRVIDMFGLGEDIVGTMANMVFAGNVNFRIDKNKRAQKLVDELYFDGDFIELLKEAYKTAIAMSGKGESYIFVLTNQEYYVDSYIKLKDHFMGFEVVPSFEIDIIPKGIERKYYHYFVSEGKEKYYDIRYRYETEDGKTTLSIYGYDDNNVLLDENLLKETLDITSVYEEYDFIPYERISIGNGMLPNILFLEDRLSTALYYQDIDLDNSQTNVYIPQHMLTDLDGQKSESIYDRFNRYKILGGSTSLNQMVVIQEGKSAIANIEKNIALNVLRGCLDAKISPNSLQYTMLDRLGSNTDVGADKERASIRLRENHIIRLKPSFAKLLVIYLKLNGINSVGVLDIAVLFDPYITPSVEQLTNTLSKQVQFGLKSRQLASGELNKNELTEEELEQEYERIKELGTQIDYNVDQREQARKGESNNLKGDGVNTK